MRENGFSDAFSFSAYQDFFRPFVEPFEAAAERSLHKTDRPVEDANGHIAADYVDGKLPYQTLVHLNMEVWGLAMRRARAYAAIPSKLANCRTATDVAGQQMEFWRAAMRHYTECAEHSAAITRMALPMATAIRTPQDSRGSSVDSNEAHTQSHDYVDVSQAKTDPEAAPASRSMPVERRAARSRKAA